MTEKLGKPVRFAKDVAVGFKNSFRHPIIIEEKWAKDDERLRKLNEQYQSQGLIPQEIEVGGLQASPRTDTRDIDIWDTRYSGAILDATSPRVRRTLGSPRR